MTNTRTAIHHPRGRVVLGALLVAGVAVVAGGCAGSTKKSSTPNVASPSATSSGATSGSETTGTDGPTSVWHQDAVAHRGKNGTSFTVDCTPKGTANAVWGAGTYTDDSSICTAAVQSGLITLAKGGTVTYQIAAGQDSYQAGAAHGVSSDSYASWAGSFTFPAATSGVPIAAGPESWSQNASAYRGQNAKQVTVVCSSNGTLGSVWGSGPYTDDSSVCTAAVQAGLITQAKGGSVLMQIAPGQNSYKGSTAHGVTSSDYGSWSGSFTFPSGQPTS